jgi:UDP-N-acetylmuramoyl-L-alanyl-D-glutamate--2,6-diaminopimelate ligase
MKISTLTEGMPITHSNDMELEVSGITHDSRKVEPGDLFVALVGQQFDGRAFVPQAIKQGAVAVLASGPAPSHFEGLWLQTHDARKMMSTLAARFYCHPDREMLVVGVTGTNGKSTVSHLVASILEAAGRPTGTVGTLGYSFGGDDFPGDRTTPEATELFQMLSQMRQAGAEAVSLEVSSHGLALGRVQEIEFDLAIFCNLTRDHLDFHRNFEGYFAAKRRLFEQLTPGGLSVVNVDDPFGRRLAESLSDPLTFGEDGDVRIGSVDFDITGTHGVLMTPKGDFEFRSPLLGAYNLENILAAVAGVQALDIDHGAIKHGLDTVVPLPGRMERVEAGQPFPVIVDYAHTDAALEAALKSVRSFSNRKILLIFGCGGDRDPGKRQLMGQIAGKLADLSIITSDNPRTEDPLAIIASVEEGIKETGNPSYRILPDRREAIRRAMFHADEEWAVLVAGKGHEQIQTVGDREVPFSDRLEIEAALEERFGSRAGD